MAVDICYPAGTDWSCYGTPAEIAELDPAKKERSEALAWSMLQSLMGYRLSICPVVIRPCAARCDPRSYYTAPVEWESGGFWPYLSGGTWYNACGCSDSASCSCSAVSEVLLPEVGSIESITLNGLVLSPSAYRVDNGKSLIRLDGGTWPLCQDMEEPGGVAFEPVTLSSPQGSVTFTRDGNVVKMNVVLTGVDETDSNIGDVPWPPTVYLGYDLPGSAYLEVNTDGEVHLFGAAGVVGNLEFAYVTDAPGPDERLVRFVPDGVYNAAWTGTLLFRRVGNTVTMTINATGSANIAPFTQGILLNAVPEGFRVTDIEGSANSLAWNESAYSIQVNGETAVQSRVVAFYSTVVTPAGQPFNATVEWETSDPPIGPGSGTSFLVSYYPGIAPNDLTRYAAGLLAAEFYKACDGGECRLPTGVTNIARAGITYTMEGVTFPGGMSGIPEVDAVIRIYNPHGLKGPSRVMSPDRLRGRTQTWRS